MALQSTGIISLNDIQNEFGGANPINLSEYYRGGIYVPDISQNNTIPSSGQISVSDFYGASAGFVMTVTEGSDVSPFSEQYGYYVGSNFNGTPNYSSQWGSVSPTQYNGALLMQASVFRGVKNPGDSFSIAFQHARPQSFFESVTVQGGGTLTSASATYSQLKNVDNLVLSTRWIWNIPLGSYSNWDGSGTSTITFI